MDAARKVVSTFQDSSVRKMDGGQGSSHAECAQFRDAKHALRVGRTKAGQPLLSQTVEEIKVWLGQGGIADQPDGVPLDAHTQEEIDALIASIGLL